MAVVQNFTTPSQGERKKGGIDVPLLTQNLERNTVGRAGGSQGQGPHQPGPRVCPVVPVYISWTALGKVIAGGGWSGSLGAGVLGRIIPAKGLHLCSRTFGQT